MIDQSTVERIGSWVEQAVTAGPKVLLRAPKAPSSGNYSPPTILVNALRDSRICREEALVLIVTVSPFASFAETLAAANDSDFGMQVGVLTDDLAHAWAAFEVLDAVGVILNGTPTYRIDHMLYGRVKNSGLGPEGIRWSIQHMTELKLFVIPGRAGARAG